MSGIFLSGLGINLSNFNYELDMQGLVKVIKREVRTRIGEREREREREREGEGFCAWIG